MKFVVYILKIQMMRIINLMILISVIFYSCAQASVPGSDRRGDEEQVVHKPYYEEGVVYSLPRNGLKVIVEVEKTTFIPGHYAAYAKKYLGINNVVQNEKKTWKIKGVRAEMFSEPDPNAVFETNDSLVGAVSLLSTGIIKGVNVEGEESEISLNGVEMIISESEYNNVFTDLSSDNFYEILVDTETGAEDFETKTTEVKAREAADYIMRLRQKRAYTILGPSDVVPEDGVAFKVLVEEIKRIEEEYVALFAGKKFTNDHQMCFHFIPEGDNVKNEVLFRFSESAGIVPVSNVSGKPVFINITKDAESSHKAAALKESNNPNSGESGLFYRFPVNASIEITDGIITFFKGRTTFSQMGAIAPFPANLINDSTKIEYNTQTGTIKSVSNK
jgi:hypothetical protein